MIFRQQCSTGMHNRAGVAECRQAGGDLDLEHRRNRVTHGTSMRKQKAGHTIRRWHLCQYCTILGMSWQWVNQAGTIWWWVNVELGCVRDLVWWDDEGQVFAYLIRKGSRVERHAQGHTHMNTHEHTHSNRKPRRDKHRKHKGRNNRNTRKWGNNKSVCPDHDNILFGGKFIVIFNTMDN